MKTDTTLDQIALQLGLRVETYDEFIAISALVEGEDGWSRECGVDYYPGERSYYDWQDGNGLLASGSSAQLEAVRELAQQCLPTLEVVEVRRGLSHSEVLVREVHPNGTTDAEETLWIAHSFDLGQEQTDRDIEEAIAACAASRGVSLS